MMRKKNSMLDYEDWYDENAEEICIGFSEQGCYYELDFDEESELEGLYEEYCNDYKV